MSKSPAKSSDRQARLASALRANLKRRKARARAQAPAGKGEPALQDPGAGPVPVPGGKAGPASDN